jgi:hypothetical protein
MTEKLKNIIKEEVMKLPKEAQEAIDSLDWGSIAEEIGKKYLLNESEINDLQAETLTVLLGLTDLEDYTRGIENEIGTTKDDANKIANEALQKIFTPINNIFLENIKKSGKDKKGNAEQNLDFILSGGDYSAFMNSPLEEYSDTKSEGGGSISSPDKGRFGGVEFNSSTPSRQRATPQDGNNSRKMDDIKSKFTI